MKREKQLFTQENLDLLQVARLIRRKFSLLDKDMEGACASNSKGWLGTLQDMDKLIPHAILCYLFVSELLVQRNEELGASLRNIMQNKWISNLEVAIAAAVVIVVAHSWKLYCFNKTETATLIRVVLRHQLG